MVKSHADARHGVRMAGLLLLLGSVALFAVSAVALTAGSSVLKTVSSVYNGELTVSEDATHSSRYLLAQSRQGLVLQGRIDLNRKQELTMGYFQVMALLTALHPDPEHVYNMGLGGGAMPRFHLSKYPKSQVVSVEIDAAVVALAKEFFFVTDSRHQILDGDGFDVLQRQPGKYDVVWVDTVTPKEGPKAYIQAKYLNVLKEHLNEGGLIVANLGESKSPESFSGVERGYRQGYGHGIRVKSPLPLPGETLDGVRVPELQPSYFVAVGNGEALNCASFWKIYEKWILAKTVSIGWGPGGAVAAKAAGVCQDL